MAYRNSGSRSDPTVKELSCRKDGSFWSQVSHTHTHKFDEFPWTLWWCHTMPFLRGEVTARFINSGTHCEPMMKSYETYDEAMMKRNLVRNWFMVMVMALDLDAIIIAAWHLESKALSWLLVVEIRLSWMSIHRCAGFEKSFLSLGWSNAANADGFLADSRRYTDMWFREINAAQPNSRRKQDAWVRFVSFGCCKWNCTEKTA